MVDFTIKVDASELMATLKEAKKCIALLTPPISRCIICGKIKDQFGNHVRHFWYHKLNAKIIPFNSRCNGCFWPLPVSEWARQNALKIGKYSSEMLDPVPILSHPDWRKTEDIK